MAVCSEIRQGEEVRLTTSDGGVIYGTLFGKKDSSSGVVLAHGMVFNKESWYEFAGVLADEGFLVFPFDFRGYGKSVAGSEKKDGMYIDILSAAKYLKEQGADEISVVGGSMGAAETLKAAIEDKGVLISKLVLLSPPSVSGIQTIKVSKLFIGSENEPLAEDIRNMFFLASEPKLLKLLPGKAHAQHIFKTEHANDLKNTITSFLKDKNKAR